jgi:putative transcriptional regulator
MRAVRRARPQKLLLAGLLLLASAGGTGAQSTLLAPEKGRFLVARENLGDPNFFRTVVLLLDYNGNGAMGVIVNRPTSVVLSDILPKVEALAGRPDTVYLGGPVEPGGLLLVVRHGEQPAGFTHVAADLYIGADIESLTALLAGGADSGRVRAYAGYAGWGPGQLNRELERGSWIVTRAAPEQVFDPSPQRLWRKLIDSAKVRFARLGADALLH